MSFHFLETFSKTVFVRCPKTSTIMMRQYIKTKWWRFVFGMRRKTKKAKQLTGYKLVSHDIKREHLERDTLSLVIAFKTHQQTKEEKKRRQLNRSLIQIDSESIAFPLTEESIDKNLLEKKRRRKNNTKWKGNVSIREMSNAFLGFN